jgi:hypothetical protein
MVQIKTQYGLDWPIYSNSLDSGLLQRGVEVAAMRLAIQFAPGDILVFTSPYTHKYTYVYISFSTYIHVYLHPSICLSIYLPIYLYIYLNIYIYIYIYIYLHIYVYIYIHIYICIWMCGSGCNAVEVDVAAMRQAIQFAPWTSRFSFSSFLPSSLELSDTA